MIYKELLNCFIPSGITQGKKNINKQTNARTEYLAGKPTDLSTDILRLNVRGSGCSVFCSVLLSFRLYKVVMKF